MEALIKAFKEEFEGTRVYVSDHVPDQVIAPAVYLVPGDPFLEPHGYNSFLEHWEALVCVSFKDKELGVDQARNISLKVRKAATSVGVQWTGAEAPRWSENETSMQVLVINNLSFKSTN